MGEGDERGRGEMEECVLTRMKQIIGLRRR